MFQRKPKRFRRRSNGRNHFSRGGDRGHPRLKTNSFTHDQGRNNFRNIQSAEKLFEKYTTLAKEAISSGDKTLGENYLQHADHFMRVIEDKNKNKVSLVDRSATNNNLSTNENIQGENNPTTQENKNNNKQ
tara:strand:- start:184 stop:576 length:393 start_codon:yes stop_codon:yes gene_type:complete